MNTIHAYIITGNLRQVFCFGTHRIRIVTSYNPATEFIIIQLYELSMPMWDLC
jgi:hypothetical protein